MRQLLLTTTLLIISILPASAAIKKFEPNPINVAAVIVEQTDSAQVASTCEYYGFTYQGAEDGYTVMKRKNATEIRFSFKDKGYLQEYPIVVVKTKGTNKEIDERLKAVNFEKEGNIYTASHNKYSRYITQCSVGPHNTFKFQRIKNQSYQR